MNKLFLFLLIPFLVSAVTYDVTVPANVQWFNSEIEVYENEFVSISSNGEWQYDPRPNFKTGPDGIVKGSISKGSLLMRCDYDVILIGSKWEGVIEKNCILEFGMYDDLTYSHNLGEMNLQIEIDRELINELETDEEEIDEINNEEEFESEIVNEEVENQMCGIVAFIVLFLIGVSYVYEKK